MNSTLNCNLLKDLLSQTLKLQVTKFFFYEKLHVIKTFGN